MTGHLRIAMVGHGFMGRAHSQAWRSVNSFFDLPLQPRLAYICGRQPGPLQAMAQRMGWERTSTDWRQVVEEDGVDLVDICTPGVSHAEIAIAALAAGKHVLCEKPLSNTLAEAQAMADAAAEAAGRGVRSMVGFNYRRVPAIELAHRLVADGHLGRVHHIRAFYLQDWLVDPQAPLGWRLRADQAGSGALGDLGSHAVDLAQHLGHAPITEVAGVSETFVRERPLTPSAASLDARVTVDDATLALARTAGDALVGLEATRYATGRKNSLRLEVNGSEGSLAFDLERLNELEFCDQTTRGGFRKILVTEPDDPWVGSWWPPGHVLGWEHTFIHQAADLLQAIAEYRDPSPGFGTGAQVQAVLDAVARSATSRQWEKVKVIA